MSHRSTAALLAVVIPLAGCLEVPRACTEIGCTDGVSIELQDAAGQPLEGLSGTLTFDGQALAFDCGDDTGGGNDPGVTCLGGSIWLDLATPDTIDYAIDYEGATHTGQVSLDYEELQPNGPDCPPVCEQASATITLEA